MNMFEDQIGHF